MKLTKQEGCDVLDGDHKDWKTVGGTKKMVDQSRWSIVSEAVFEHTPTKKFYSMFWSMGATEQQDELPFEYDEPVLTEVELKEVTVKKWVAVKNG